MPKFKISNEYISKCNDTEISEYPKYTTQVINLANQNAGGTRPRNVGQLSELLPEYLSSPGKASLSGWKEWYNERYPDAVNNAVDRVWDQVNKERRRINSTAFFCSTGATPALHLSSLH